MHFIYLCAIHLLKFIYLIIYKYRHTAINTTSASQKLPLAPHTPLPSLPHFHNLLPGHLVLFNRFPIFISGGAPAPPSPSPPRTDPIHLHVGRGTAPAANRRLHRCGEPLPARPPLSVSIGFPSRKHWDAGAAQHKQNCLKPKGHPRALSAIPFLPTAEWVFFCPRVPVRSDGSGSGVRAEPHLGQGHSCLLSRSLLLPSPKHK